MSRLLSAKNDMMPELLLVSPPFWDYYSPFLALPTLAAFLRNKGWHIDVVDWNILYFRKSIVYKLERCFDELCNQPERYDALGAIYKRTFGAKDHAEFIRRGSFVTNELLTPEGLRSRFWSLDVTHLNFLDALYHLAYFGPVYGRIKEVDVSEMCWESSLSKATYSELDRSIEMHIIRRIEKTPPRFVGFSIICREQLMISLYTAYMIKLRFPRIQILFGGSYVPIMLHFVNSNGAYRLFKIIDYLVSGEGETALDLLLKNSADCLQYDIPNLVRLREGGQLYYSTRHLEDVCELPCPDFSDMPLSDYFSPSLVLPYQASRGCFWGRCSFCDHDEDYRHHFRNKPPHKVATEIAELRKRYGINHLQFNDEAIAPVTIANLSKVWNGQRDFHWMGYTRFSKVFTPELCQKIADSGGRMFLFGVESFNNRILDLMQKGTSFDLIRNNLMAFSDAGISTGIWMISGFPTQSREEMLFDVEQAQELSDHIEAIFAGFFRLERACEIAKYPERYGIVSYDPNDSLTFVSRNGDLEILSTEVRQFFELSCLPEFNALSLTHNRYILFLRGRAMTALQTLEVEGK